MKAFLLFIVLFALVSSQSILSHGWSIPHEGTKCCWLNSNGCCQPPKRGQMCTMALRACCKTKVYDEKTKTYKIVYN